MKQIIIHLDSPEIQALEKDGDKIAITKVKKTSIFGLVWINSLIDAIA
jgi:phospholipid-translocating ATPase